MSILILDDVEGLYAETQRVQVAALRLFPSD
jgi:hypothetical protein